MAQSRTATPARPRSTPRQRSQARALVLFMADGAACGALLDAAFFNRGELLRHFSYHVYAIEVAIAIVFGATCLLFLTHIFRPLSFVRYVFSASAGGWLATCVYAGFWVSRPALGVIFLALAVAATVFSYYEVTDW